MKYFLFFLFFYFLFASGKSQGNFNLEELPKQLVTELNKFRIKNGLDTFEVNQILTNVAEIDAKKMSKSGQVKTDQGAVKKNLIKLGGSNKCEEVAMNAPVSKGRDNYKTDQVAKVIYNRWENNKNDKETLLKANYSMIGIKCLLDKDSKKVYAVAVIGGYESFNAGAKKKKELTVPFNSKSKKLLTANAKSCKNCDTWKNFDLLQKGLFVEKGKIYLEYGNLKDLKKILKKTNDGLAVDVVQRAQYENPEYNIVDHKFQNKGIMQKVINKDAVFAKNLIKPDPKAKKKVKINNLKLEMGKLNPKIKGPYELNLIVIQDGHVCKTVTRSYLETSDIGTEIKIGLLPAPESIDIKPAFEPLAEGSILNFIIPFEKNKFEFKLQDIQPFIEALNEPDFVINGLYIYAYSSIEGDAKANAKLQRKRAESVTNALQKMQQTKFITNIETKDSWDLFELEVEGGKYDDLVKLGKEKAIRKINSDKKLIEELEPVFARERFAQIVLDVNYNVSEDNEQKFTTSSFNKAIKSKKTKLAYKIMEYAFNQLNQKKYSEEVIDSLKIPNEAAFSNLLNNKIYFNYLANGKTVDDEDYKKLIELEKIDPANDILRYNRIYASIFSETTKRTDQENIKMQQEIDAFYKTKIDKKLVDGLNIEWQFKYMETDEAGKNNSTIIDECLKRIKTLYNIENSSWQSSLKLAHVIVTRTKDYKLSSSLLEPFLKANPIDESLLFGYISIAGHLPEKFYSRTFSDALRRAKEKNLLRYCQLFGEPYMSFQVLDNPATKADYREAGCSNK